MVHRVVRAEYPASVSISVRYRIYFRFQAGLTLKIPMFIGVIEGFNNVIFLFGAVSFRVRVYPLLNAMRVIVER